MIAFFRSNEPLSGNGWARLAEAYAATGRPAEALAAAQSAWKSADLASTDEALLLARFGPHSPPPIMTAASMPCCSPRKPSDAARLLPWASAARRAALDARIAMHTRSPDAERLYAAAVGPRGERRRAADGPRPLSARRRQ